MANDLIKLDLSGIKSFVKTTLKDAVSELKDIDQYLTKISVSNEKLSKSDLAALTDNAFDIAGKYGKDAADYLAAVEEATHAGYENAEAIAELSVAAQTAGDMTAELANQFIVTADNAYELNGSVEKLTELLDGSNSITNRNAVSMTELAEGMAVVGSTAASLGVEAAETTAALGTLIAATRQGGSETAEALRDILLYTGQVADETKGISTEGLSAYERACESLNVSLKETRNGVLSLRDPMKVLQELSAAYSKLDETDIRRTDLLNSVGSRTSATQLDALLSNWSAYESMLQQYQAGTGSMAAEAEKTADSWEGALNRLKNTWVDTVGNIADSDAIITAINSLNELLSVLNRFTDWAGSFGTLGIGAGLFAGLQNVGRDKMLSLKQNNLFEICRP